MDTCQFTYIRTDDLKQTAVGVEQSWDVLCAKLDREGPGLPDGTHYFTISIEGPQLFAIDVSGTNVYYHHDGKWHRYITACDIQFGTMDDNGLGCPPRAYENQIHLHTTGNITLFQRISSMDTCEFSYISRVDSMPKRVLGIERSWEELKKEMGRTGPGCSGAIYFKTISYQGPQLFAVVNNDSVFYHDHEQWYRYITACDIKFGTMESNNLNPDRSTSEDAVIQQATDESDWTFIPQDKYD